MKAVEKAAAADSLHFHVTSERLFLDNLVFDADGVAMKHYRAQGNQYNPLFVAWWGLVNLERYVHRSDEACLKTFLTQVRWLKAQAVERPDGAVIWPCYFDWQEGWCRLRSPWYSAMYQGVVISALVRAYRLTHDRELLELCDKGTRVFEKTIEEGGVRTIQNGRVLYEEYPAYPLARVLDGFMFSLLGLYDLHVQTRNPALLRLFTEGIDGLTAALDFWNYRNKWSWYGAHGYLCPPHYHKLNYVLLSILGRLTGEKILYDYAERWDIKSKSIADKVEIYVMYILTQNMARLRLPRN
ncbi:MAG: D-glucuronyl C5-epimerase family protein [Nitrospiraceae bacterium]